VKVHLYYGSLSLIIDVADPSPNCDYQIQMEIWFRDKNSHNWFYLLILSIRTAWGLNRSRTPLVGSKSGHVSLACLVLKGHVAWSRRGRKLTTTGTNKYKWISITQIIVSESVSIKNQISISKSKSISKRIIYLISISASNKIWIQIQFR